MAFLSKFQLFSSTFFFNVSENDILSDHDQPVRVPAKKRKKPFKNHVRKRIKTDQQIEEGPIVGLISDDEDAEFVRGPVIKKSRDKKKG